MPNYHFYRDLPLVTDFQKIFDDATYVPVPPDWYVVITDVMGSTKAIEEGRYKDVNIAGGIATMAVSNLYKDLDYPFVFGGDGITFLIPEAIAPQVKDILVDTRQMCREHFNLDLRIGFLRVADIYAVGERIDIAKFKVSQPYNQAMISGSGLDYAESKLKSRTEGHLYAVPDDYVPQQKADFSGFTCRWQDIKSHKGETISLIIKLKKETDKLLLKDIFDGIQAILGTEQDYHPLSEENMKLADESYFTKEATILSRQAKGGEDYARFLKIAKQESFNLRWILRLRLNITYRKHKARVLEVKKTNIIASDFRKYDGTLKMVLSCTRPNREKLAAYLESIYQQGQIYYGIHASDRALMTCLMYENTGREVHFIDSAEGGYAFAARQLKKQLADNQLK